jgi:hypothetical protein
MRKKHVLFLDGLMYSYFIQPVQHKKRSKINTNFVQYLEYKHDLETDWGLVGHDLNRASNRVVSELEQDQPSNGFRFLNYESKTPQW